jgi:beta-phosphoglucomutase-like phosphatase (HAD superfamily)
MLRRLVLVRYSEVIGTQEDVREGNPAPDIFLYVAQCPKVTPTKTVIEDVEKGIVAAQRAGMKNMAIPDQFTRDDGFSAASDVVGSLLEIEKLVESLQARSGCSSVY